MSLDLRAPPVTQAPVAPRGLLWAIVGLQVACLGAVAWTLLGPAPVDPAERRLRTVASKLKAAGARGIVEYPLSKIID